MFRLGDVVYDIYFIWLIKLLVIHIINELFISFIHIYKKLFIQRHSKMADNNYKKEFNLAERTISELQKYGIPPNPKCYEVMYSFLNEDNLEVTNAINKFLENNPQLTEACLLKIHSSVLSHETIARTVNIVTNLLTKEMHSLNNSMTNSDQELSVFNDAIDTLSQHIDNETVIDKTITDYVLEATKRIKNKIKDLDDSLSNSNEEIRKLQTYLEGVCQESMLDPLTTLATRKKSDQILSRAIFHDKWGTVTSEQILRFIATSLKENIKGRDTASRFSKSLFLLILPQTETNGAFTLAEHIRNTIERKRIIKKTTGEFIGRITVSSGVAQFRSGESIGYLMNRAEKMLDAARDNGRNCTVTEENIDAILNNQQLPKAS